MQKNSLQLDFDVSSELNLWNFLKIKNLIILKIKQNSP